MKKQLHALVIFCVCLISFCLFWLSSGDKEEIFYDVIVVQKEGGRCGGAKVVLDYSAGYNYNPTVLIADVNGVAKMPVDRAYGSGYSFLRAYWQKDGIRFGGRADGEPSDFQYPLTIIVERD